MRSRDVAAGVALLVLGAALLSLLLRETHGRNVWSELADGA